MTLHAGAASPLPLANREDGKSRYGRVGKLFGFVLLPHHYANSTAPVFASCFGDRPNMRAYSRLNCEGLS